MFDLPGCVRGRTFASPVQPGAQDLQDEDHEDRNQGFIQGLAGEKDTGYDLTQEIGRENEGNAGKRAQQHRRNQPAPDRAGFLQQSWIDSQHLENNSVGSMHARSFMRRVRLKTRELRLQYG